MPDLSIAQRIADQVVAQLNANTSGGPNELWDMRGNSTADGATVVYLEDEDALDEEETGGGSPGLRTIDRVVLVDRLIAHADNATPDPGATTKQINQACAEIHDAIMANREMIEADTDKRLAIDTTYQGARAAVVSSEDGEHAEVHAVVAFRVQYETKGDNAHQLRDGTSVSA